MRSVDTPCFLIVAPTEDDRVLYSRTLFRTFPRCVVKECGPEQALQLAAAGLRFAGLVLHFNGSVESLAVLKTYRAAQPTMPIVALSGAPRQSTATAAGATAFLPAAEWLTLGDVMRDLLKPVVA